MALEMEGIEGMLASVSQRFGSFEFVNAVAAVAIFAGAYALLWLAIKLATWIGRHVGARTNTTLDEALSKGTRRPLNLLAIAVSAYIALSLTMRDGVVAGVGLDRIFFLAFIFITAYLLARTISVTIKWYGKGTGGGARGMGKEVFPIVRKMISIAIYLAALVIVLDHLGVQIGPLVAGLGIAGLAVALALQDTLSNFFAGIYLLADKPVRIGNYVRLDDGSEGYVEEIGWRSTKVKLLTDTTLIIPNSAFAQQKIINYYSQEGIIAFVNVGAGYGSDPEKVERVLLETADSVVEKAHGAIKSFKPGVRLVNLGDSGLEYVVFFRVEKFTDQRTVSSLMRKEILKAFRKAKVEIPFPTRTLYMRKE